MSHPTACQAQVNERIKRERISEAKLQQANHEKEQLGQDQATLYPNPFNPGNRQDLAPKVASRHEASIVPDETRSEFLKKLAELRQPSVSRFPYPQTSAQEIGWFTKEVPLCEFRQDPRVNHPLVHSDLTRYKSVYWRYYPSGFHKAASGPKM